MASVPAVVSGSGGCCCGGASTDCCPYGDPPDELCLEAGTFPSVGADWILSGQSFTLTRGAGSCSWTYTATTGPDLILTSGGLTCTWHPFDISVTASFDGAGGAVSLTFLIRYENTAGLGCPGGIVSVGNIIGGGTPTAVSGCLPQTGGGGTYFDPLDSPFGSYTAPDCTLSSGPCGGGFMAVAPALATKSAPAPAIAPCRFEGEELTGAERAAAKLDHRRRWYRCGLPGFARFGLPVTDCRACGVPDAMRCGPACPGYVAAE